MSQPSINALQLTNTGKSPFLNNSIIFFLLSVSVMHETDLALIPAFLNAFTTLSDRAIVAEKTIVDFLPLALV
jgi:hypothetical protein